MTKQSFVLRNMHCLLFIVFVPNVQTVIKSKGLHRSKYAKCQGPGADVPYVGHGRSRLVGGPATLSVRLHAKDRTNEFHDSRLQVYCKPQEKFGLFVRNLQATYAVFFAQRSSAYDFLCQGHIKHAKIYKD